MTNALKDGTVREITFIVLHDCTYLIPVHHPSNFAVNRQMALCFFASSALKGMVLENISNILRLMISFPKLHLGLTLNVNKKSHLRMD